MPKYKVAFASCSERELRNLPVRLIPRLAPHLENLASNPRPFGCKNLAGGDGERRIRVGDYRVVYTIDDAKLLVEVTRIRHRSEVYQR